MVLHGVLLLEYAQLIECLRYTDIHGYNVYLKYMYRVSFRIFGKGGKCRVGAEEGGGGGKCRVGAEEGRNASHTSVAPRGVSGGPPPENI